MVISSLILLFSVVPTKPPGCFQQSWHPSWQSPLELVLCPRAQDTTLVLVQFHEIPVSARNAIPAPGTVCTPPELFPHLQKGLKQGGSREALEEPRAAPHPLPGCSPQEQLCPVPGWLYLQISACSQGWFSWVSAASCLLVPHQVVIWMWLLFVTETWPYFFRLRALISPR